MRRISSRTTFLYKRLFPMVWFGFLAFFILMGLRARGSVVLPAILGPAAMAIFGYFLMKKLIFDLVDEVWDTGDELIVKNKGREDRIPLSAVVNVSYSAFTSPPRVTLTLRDGGVLGREITFCPPVRFVPFSKSPIINELIERIDKKRSGH